MGYRLMWSPVDKADIRAEMAALRAAGHDVELAQVLAYVNSIATAGPTAHSQHIHMRVGNRNLHSARPFQTVGVFYAYESPPTTQLFILAFCTNLLAYVGNAAVRLTNVP